MKAADALDVPVNGNDLGALIGALAVAAASAVIFSFVELGPLSGHMAMHIGTMNVAAPLAAVALRRRYPKRQGGRRLQGSGS